jgi:hypothetical protein
MLVTGPAVVQFPATSQTARVFVAALAVSAPVGRLAESKKLASAVLASPAPLSLAVQAIVTSLARHWVSG